MVISKANFSPGTVKAMIKNAVLSEKQGVERGFYLCRRGKKIVKARTLRGTEDEMPDYRWEADEAQCPESTEEVGNFHTHIDGKCYPSGMDVTAANVEEHSISCIGTPKKGACWSLKGIEHSENMKPDIVL